MMKKPSVLSGLGLAACVALVVTFVLPLSETPTVQAATIMKQLNEQVEQGKLFEVVIDSVGVDEAFINGTLQLSDLGVAGDLEVKVNEGDDEKIDIDISLAVGGDGGWILFRKLVINDDDAKAMLGAIFPPGTETLLKLPGGEFGDIGSEIMGGIGDVCSEDLMNMLRQLVESQEVEGATIENQSDGTVLMTLPLDSAEAIAALERLAHKSDEHKSAGTGHGEDEEAEADEHDSGVVIQAGHGDGDLDLLGTTLRVVYDPATKLVRSFALDNLGGAGGGIRVTIGEGEGDPALFDSSRVTTPRTRTFDMSQFQALIEGM